MGTSTTTERGGAAGAGTDAAAGAGAGAGVGAGVGRRAQQKAETRKRLLTAARTVFAEGSVVTTPLDAVASGAGVSKATLFFHFADRGDLLEALAGEILIEMYEELEAAPVRPSSLRAFVRSYLALQHDPRPALLWEVGDVLSADGRPLPDLAYQHLKDELGRHLRAAGVAAERAERLTGVLAPAVFLVARRVAFGVASEAEIDRFLDDLDALVG